MARRQRGARVDTFNIAEKEGVSRRRSTRWSRAQQATVIQPRTPKNQWVVGGAPCQGVRACHEQCCVWMQKRYASSQKSRHVGRVRSAHLEQMRHIAPSPYWTALRELSARSSSSCAHSEENSANAPKPIPLVSTHCARVRARNHSIAPCMPRVSHDRREAHLRSLAPPTPHSQSATRAQHTSEQGTCPGSLWTAGASSRRGKHTRRCLLMWAS